MLVSDVLMWVAIASGFVVGMPALWMLSRGLWPDSFAKRIAVAKKSLALSFFAGLVFSIVCAVFVVALNKLVPKGAAFLNVTSIGILVVWGLTGVVGIASLVGERLWPQGEPWRQTRNGGLILICCALIPIIGWALFLPLMAIIGIGVNIRCLFSRAPRSLASEVSAPMIMESSVGSSN